MTEKGILSTKQNGWKWNYYPLNKMAEKGILSTEQNGSKRNIIH